MFSYTTKSGKLTIEEVFNGFQVTNNETGETRGCGDGTQWVSDEDAPEDAERMRNDRITDDIEGGEYEWIGAYFGK